MCFFSDKFGFEGGIFIARKEDYQVKVIRVSAVTTKFEGIVVGKPVDGDLIIRLKKAYTPTDFLKWVCGLDEPIVVEGFTWVTIRATHIRSGKKLPKDEFLAVVFHKRNGPDKKNCLLALNPTYLTGLEEFNQA